MLGSKTYFQVRVHRILLYVTCWYSTICYLTEENIEAQRDPITNNKLYLDLQSKNNGNKFFMELFLRLQLQGVGNVLL